MICRSVAVLLGIAAMLNTASAWAQEPDEPKVDAAQTPERDDNAATSTSSPRHGAGRKKNGLPIASRHARASTPASAGWSPAAASRLAPAIASTSSTSTCLRMSPPRCRRSCTRQWTRKARWARFWGDRIEIWSDFRYRDYPEEDYFGLGVDSSEPNRITYAIESTDIVGRALLKATPWLTHRDRRRLLQSDDRSGPGRLGPFDRGPVR